MTYADTVKFLVSMVVMMNPLGSLSIFLQLTHRTSALHKHKTAMQCGLAMIIIMIVSLWFGRQLLDLLGITISSFRCAGGIILLLVGLSMLQSQESPLNYTPADDAAAEDRHSIGVVPLALPIIIGPGAISTLVLASNDFPIFVHKLWLSLLCLFLAVSMGAILFYGVTISKLVGESVIKVITRIMGMLVMAIAVGMFADGLIGLIPGLK